MNSPNKTPSRRGAEDASSVEGPSSGDQTPRLESVIQSLVPLLTAEDPQKLVTEVLRCGTQIFQVEGCSLGTIDEEKDEIVFSKMEGSMKTDQFRVALGQGIAGWVAQHREGVLSNDVSQDPRFFGGVDRKSGYVTRNLVCVPLLRGEKVVGVLQALNTSRPGGFLEEDLTAFSTFADLVLSALDRNRDFLSAKANQQILQENVRDRYQLVGGDSPAMTEALTIAQTVAPAPTTVLLLGESGTGKEVVARAIHYWGDRSNKPFVAINCAALAAELLESELFGHEKGSFTGAIAQKKGKFELASEGTLFLDEIGELPLPLQAKLLRVLQEKEFQRVGGVKDIRTDCRVIAATNRNLREAVDDGKFREDLFYRLNVVSIPLPPLRERGTDVEKLALHFLERYCREMKRPLLAASPELLERVQQYSWPGNVRELQNAMERAVVLATGEEISVTGLPPEVRGDVPVSASADSGLGGISESLSLAEAVDEFKRMRIRRALEASNGNQTQAAKALGLRQPNLSRLIKTLGL